MGKASEHFDAEAASYPIEIGQSHTQHLKWVLLEQFINSPAVIADIGAATGRHAIPLAEKGNTVLALDLSVEMLRQMKVKCSTGVVGRNLFPVVAKLPDLPIGADRFDAVYSYSTLLLLPPAKQKKAMRQMAYSLKPGGIAVFDLANARSIGIRYWHRYYRQRGMDGVFGHDHGNLSHLVADLGLEIVAVHPQGLLSQFLLIPLAAKIPGVMRAVSGERQKPGWDDVVSRMFPSFAERWYVVARRPVNDGASSDEDNTRP